MINFIVMKKQYIKPKVNDSFPIVHSMIMESQTPIISNAKQRHGEADARQMNRTYTEQADELNQW